MTTLTANRDEEWECSCGNDESRQGFHACTEDGEDCMPVLGEGWAGHFRCNRCLFVFTESDLIREA